MYRGKLCKGRSLERIAERLQLGDVGRPIRAMDQCAFGHIMSTTDPANENAAPAGAYETRRMRHRSTIRRDQQPISWHTSIPHPHPTACPRQLSNRALP